MGIELYGLLLAALTAVASGMVGSFALMRRMALAGDSLAHVALPGIALALLYSANPVIGGAIALIIGALIIWKVEMISKLTTESVIGVLFALSLAVGAIAIEEEHELIETLFGGVTTVTGAELVVGAIIAAGIIWFIIQNRRALVLALVSKELAKTSGVSNSKLQLSFLIVFSLTVILGMKFLGVLLMGSLIIIPAAAARNVSNNLTSLLVISSAAALFSVIGGIFFSGLMSAPLGPTIIIVASILFIISLVLRQKVSDSSSIS